MKSKQLSYRMLFALAVTLLALMALTGLARADNPNPKILPPQSNPFGASYGEWAARWWQWALSAPTPVNPILDETGDQCARGQSGKVWFLAGSFGATVTRNCTVPNGKALFFPIYNVIWVATEPDETAQMAQQNVKDFIDGANAADLSVEIDGVSLKHIERYRIYQNQSLDSLPVFDVTVPDDNLFGLPAGVYGPGSTDGYYVMMAPLPPGKHVVHIAVAGYLDVTYNLKVKQGK